MSGEVESGHPGPKNLPTSSSRDCTSINSLGGGGGGGGGGGYLTSMGVERVGWLERNAYHDSLRLVHRQGQQLCSHALCQAGVFYEALGQKAPLGGEIPQRELIIGVYAGQHALAPCSDALHVFHWGGRLRSASRIKSHDASEGGICDKPTETTFFL